MTGFLFFITAIHRPYWGPQKILTRRSNTDHKTTLPVTEVVITSVKTMNKNNTIYIKINDYYLGHYESKQTLYLWNVTLNNINKITHKINYTNWHLISVSLKGATLISVFENMLVLLWWASRVNSFQMLLLYEVLFFKVNWLLARGKWDLSGIQLCIFPHVLPRIQRSETQQKKWPVNSKGTFVTLSTASSEVPGTSSYGGSGVRRRGSASKLNNSPVSGKVSGDACNLAASSGHIAIKLNSSVGDESLFVSQVAILLVMEERTQEVQIAHNCFQGRNTTRFGLRVFSRAPQRCNV